MNETNNKMNANYLKHIISADDVVSAEYVSYYGLKVCVVKYNKNYPGYNTPCVYYFEDSINSLYGKYGSNYEEGLRGLKLPVVEGRKAITKIDGPMIGTPEDKEWHDNIAKLWSVTFKDDPLCIKPENDRLCELYNCCDYVAWQSIPFTDASGLQGVKDCWGNVIIPPQYEECRINAYSPIICVKQEGKWGLINPGRSCTPIVVPIFDSISGCCNLYVEIDGHYGLYDKDGEEIIPVEMDDISMRPDFFLDCIYIMKKNGKFGLRFENQTYIAPCIEKIDVPRDGDEPVRFLIENKWKYLSEDGAFTDEPSQQALKPCHLNFKSFIYGRDMLDRQLEIPLEKRCYTIEEARISIKDAIKKVYDGNR